MLSRNVSLSNVLIVIAILALLFAICNNPVEGAVKRKRPSKTPVEQLLDKLRRPGIIMQVVPVPAQKIQSMSLKELGQMTQVQAALILGMFGDAAQQEEANGVIRNYIASPAIALSS
jgi:hypothetical protein